MFLTWILIIVGFTLLTAGATWLTNGSAAVAKRLNINEFIIGMTIVAVGTSLPEMTVSVASTIAGSADIAIGNVVGSNILNILFILGTCALFTPVIFSRNNIVIDTPLCILVSIGLVLMLTDGTLSLIEGIALLACYIAVIYISYRTSKAEHSEDESENIAQFSWLKSIAMIVVGFVALIYGANLTLNSAIAVARDLGVSERVIAITLLAGGTSLPELAASLIAAIKGHGALALGNVIGSSIANILLILGCCATISPLTMSGITMIDLLVMVGATVLLLISALLYGHRKVTRIEGIIFLGAYIAYMWYLIN